MPANLIIQELHDSTDERGASFSVPRTWLSSLGIMVP